MMTNFLYDQMKQVLVKMYAEGILEMDEYLDLYTRVLNAEEKEKERKGWLI